MDKNLLFYGDNLEVLRRHVKDESVDLVYLDPPFNSNASYNVLFAEHGEKAASQIQVFEDTWQWDQESARLFFETVQMGGEVANALQAFHTLLGESNMMAYLAMMAPRLVELRRVLKPTGSLYLHCDQTASHYLKLLMDAVFGRKKFRNEVIWNYSFRMMDLPKFYNRKHDTILFYAKSANNYFLMPKTEWTKEDLLKSRKQAIHVDDDGVEWIWMPGGKGHSKNKMRRVDEILAGGKAVSDVWDIPIISSSARERLGYPTQKPEILLERIIQASSKEGDVVLDPFCGCGTTIAVAERLKRRWIGIDITHLAVNLMKHRLLNAFGEEIKKEYEVIGEPTDVGGAEQLAKEDPYQFQWWALGLVGARPVEQKKGADKGIDGRLPFHLGDPTDIHQIILSVKAGKTGRMHIHELRGVMEREKADIGVFISMAEPTRPMREEAASAGMFESPWGTHPRLQLLTVEELLEGKRIDCPPLGQLSKAFKKAPKAEDPSKQLSLGAESEE